jgi:hypothetical protein
MYIAISDGLVEKRSRTAIAVRLLFSWLRADKLSNIRYGKETV